MEFNTPQFVKKSAEADTEVTVFLGNGVKLIGKITAWDVDKTTGKLESFLLTRGNHPQLVFANQVSTILPEEAISLTSE